MPRWIVLLAFPLILAVVCVTATMGLRELDPATQAQRAEAARHDAAMNAIAEAEAAERARVLAPALALAGALLAVGASGVLVVLGAVYVYHRLQFVDVAGVSVSRQLALDGATLPAMMIQVSTSGQARIEAARNPAPILPSGLRSYAPKYANRAEGSGARGQGQPAALPAPAPSSLAPVTVPTLAQVLATRPANEVIVGYERDGHPVGLGLDAIGASLVVGERRTGKTSTVAAIAAQLAAMRAQFFVIDPHGPLADSLAQRLAPLGARVALCVATPTEASGVLRAVTSELERRIAGEEGDPCVLLVDELNSMTVGAWADVGAQVAALAQRLALEGGKMSMGVIAAAHLTNIGSVGSHFAYGATTVIAHRTVPAGVARFLGPDLARQTRHLERGQALVSYPGGWNILRVPRAEPTDMLQAVATLPAPGGSRTVLEPRTAEPPSSEASEPNGSPEPRWPIDPRALTDAEIQAIRRMRADGMSLTGICQAVFGFKNGETWPIITSALQEA